MSSIISVEQLGKKFLISHRTGVRYRTLREAVEGGLRRAGRQLLQGRAATRISGAGKEEFWALKDISFEVPEGQAVGIIGRNGAGKSTLLKILSRITEPTRGRAVLRGRLTSLLEVGTGFHPELTGRENIFLNGAILGMTKREIERKFDEIVAFSGVERFLDTPVKHYSSGMYMRLAFSVAAHLEPEILVIDEVLAVGDYEFQNRCLRKMESVAQGGRTVVFVSHNMSAVQRICSRAILIEHGSIAMDGRPHVVIDAFLQAAQQEVGERVWPDIATAPGFDDGTVKLRAIRVLDRRGTASTVFNVTEAVVVELEYDVLEHRHALQTQLHFSDMAGQTLFVAIDPPDAPWQRGSAPPGRYRLRAEVPANYFNEGRLKIEYLVCCRPHTGRHVTVPDAVTFLVIDDRDPSGARGDWAGEWPASVIRPKLSWTGKSHPMSSSPNG